MGTLIGGERPNGGDKARVIDDGINIRGVVLISRM
jgi:hypothetical protein